MNFPTINFMRYRKIFLTLSAIAVLASFGLLFSKGLNFGLDFTGGTVVEVASSQDIDLDEARETLRGTIYEDAVLQHFGSAKEVSIRVQPKEGVEADQMGMNIFNLIHETLPEIELRRIEFIGAQVGEELVEKSGLALLMAMGGIMIYVWFRFTNKVGVASLVGLFHVTVIVLGCFAFFRWTVDLTVVAAMLAMIGYAINDSIVISDYVRNTFRTSRLEDPEEVVNYAINKTIGRTIHTTLSTWLVVLALQLFGGDAVHSFSLALSVGVLLAPYSTIYIVCSLALAMNISREDFIVPVVEEVDEMP